MKKLIISLLSMLTTVPVFAGGDTRVDHLLSTYGGGSMKYKGAHLFGGTDACIGVTHTEKDCASSWNFKNDEITELEHRIFWNKQTGRSTPWFDERGYMMMVALDVRKEGAYFCPVQIGARNADNDSTWTVYYSLGQQGDFCFWVCNDGYSGPQCQNKDNYKTCDSTPIKHSTYDSLGASDSVRGSIESSVPMFQWNKYYQGHEHDMILAVTGWLESGHGVYVQPVITFCQNHATWPTIWSSVQVYPAEGSKQTLMCKDGYRPKDNDCVPADPQQCLGLDSKVCEGWESGYDETKHMFVKSSDSNEDCYQYRCKTPGYALASQNDSSCVECPASLRQGISIWDGTCVSCLPGQVFIGGSINSADKQTCGEAQALTKTDMMYGLNKTKSDVPVLSEQCWTQRSTDDYRNCVLLKEDVSPVQDEKTTMFVP